MANITDNFQTEGFVEQRKELEKLMISNPSMEKKVQGLISKVLSEVKKSMTQEARSVMESDPRNASRAVRMMVYKRILGGNVNILNKKRASSRNGSYTPTKTLRSKQRGGNRRERSERTMKLESYTGSNRGFVLRFLNAGTEPRYNGGRNGRTQAERDKFIMGHGGLYYRGQITPRNFFGPRSHREMMIAAKKLEEMIDELIKQELA